MFGGNSTRVTCDTDAFQDNTKLTAFGSSNASYSDVLYVSDTSKNEGEIFSKCT